MLLFLLPLRASSDLGKTYLADQHRSHLLCALSQEVVASLPNFCSSEGSHKGYLKWAYIWKYSTQNMPEPFTAIDIGIMIVEKQIPIGKRVDGWKPSRVKQAGRKDTAMCRKAGNLDTIFEIFWFLSLSTKWNVNSYQSFSISVNSGLWMARLDNRKRILLWCLSCNQRLIPSTLYCKPSKLKTTLKQTHCSPWDQTPFLTPWYITGY